VDVHAFGIVLYELLSVKEAIVKSSESTNDAIALVYMVSPPRMVQLDRCTTQNAENQN
jgi:hypothetical protein